MNINPKDNTEVLPEKTPTILFEQLSSKMQEAARRAGWAVLTPVQARTIPFFVARKDLMAQAQTGSGKTGAYILPLLERIDPAKNFCQALILVPTRELAQQVTADASLLAGENGIRAIAVYGGTSYKPQIEGFKQGAHLVTATPGRLLDHLLKRNLTLERLDSLIFDEADRMLSMGFLPDMLRIQDFLPDRPIHTSMFSATFPIEVMRLTNRFLDQPEFISLSREHVHVEDTVHAYYLTPGMDKDRSLVRIIEVENPPQAIIFCNTKDRVFYVTRVLQRFGYNANQISSDLSQNERDLVLNQVRKGELRFLVATDVAARGLDIPSLSHVIQYEPSEELESYIHRAGRTGRAGASGTAIMLINFNEKKFVTRIGAHYNIHFEERPLPNDEDVENLVAQRLIGQLEARMRERDNLQIERMRRFEPLVRHLVETEDGLSLLTMLLDDTYHTWMHQPLDQAPIDEASPPKRKQGLNRPRTSGRRPIKTGNRRSR